MPQYILKGIVHPERAQITLGPIKLEKGMHLSSKKVIRLELNIVVNQITIWIDTNEEWNIYDLRNIGRYFVIMICSIVSFIHGYFYEIEIIQVISHEKNIDVVFGIDTPCISERSSKKEIEKLFDEIKNFATGETGIYLTRCFKDLNFALKDAEDTAFYCFRAIESLKHYCRKKYGILEEKEQWKKLSELCGYNIDYIKNIKTAATEIRHGNFSLSDEQLRIEYLTKTWNVIENFIKKIIL